MSRVRTTILCANYPYGFSGEKIPQLSYLWAFSAVSTTRSLKPTISTISNLNVYLNIRLYTRPEILDLVPFGSYSLF